MDVITEMNRLAREGFFMQLHQLRDGYECRCPTMRLKKIPGGRHADPVQAVLACERELRELLALPEWRHTA